MNRTKTDRTIEQKHRLTAKFWTDVDGLPVFHHSHTHTPKVLILASLLHSTELARPRQMGCVCIFSPGSFSVCFFLYSDVLCL